MTTLTTLEAALRSYPIEHMGCGCQHDTYTGITLHCDAHTCYAPTLCTECSEPRLCGLERGHGGPHRGFLSEKWGTRLARVVHRNTGGDGI